MKKLFGIMVVLVLSLSLVACGGDTKESSNDASFTAEQQAFAQEFMDLAEAFDKVSDRVNATPELLEDQELVQSMNELADEIITLDDFFTSPETLTPEVMAELKGAFEAVYTFIDTAETAFNEIDNAK
jgi:hypothetical protein